MSARGSAQHPGIELRSIISESGLNVSQAAELLGVSRPGLSYVLNGKAAFSSDMARRFATAFPASADRVLELQKEHESVQSQEQAKEFMVRTYVPHFLGITARQIEAWADGNHAARGQLPSLLRRLVHGTGVPLTKVDFPAFDNSQRHGWDGVVVADAASPWVPRGDSGWEFGCDKKADKKAESDYEARTNAVPIEARASTSFVFVTPRNWPGKDEWAKAKRVQGAWKDVRALDASDLEQWLEQCPGAQAWFAEVIGSAPQLGLKSLEKVWAGWANVASPTLSKVLFRRSVEAKAKRLQEWLAKPAAEPLVVAAESEGEALAFITCALEQFGQPAGQASDGALFVETVAALERVASLGGNLILVAASTDVETAYAALSRPPHLIIARRRNSLSREPDVTLDLVDEESFRKALADMGMHQPDFHRISAQTANSPTILRRRLAEKYPSIAVPSWSSDEVTARALIPLIFAGAWDNEKEADLEIMRCLTGQEPKIIEQTIRRLDAIEDAPTWSIGKYRGVTSKIDALSATRSFITEDHLKNFLFVAEIVLAEEDPAQDLAPEKQWAAGIYGKTREHSSALRRGICETMVLLAAHGNNWLGRHVNLDIQESVSKLVRGLLTPLDGRTWSSQRQDLPRYAEAAPETFLDILEQDLASTEPKVLALMQSAENTLFGSCPRSGLLWALERLAWKPAQLPRVSRLLARLSAIHISDNWANTPRASLDAIFRNWMPQTAASTKERNAAMAALCAEFPSVGWRVIINQLGSLHAVGHDSDRPEWRNDASGAGEPVTYGEIYEVADEAMRLAIDWPRHDQHTFGDLIHLMIFIPEAEQEKIWDMITAWALSDIDDTARHQLRERIRETALTRRAQFQGAVPINVERAREVYKLLAPKDLIARHLWLFEKMWVGEAPDDDEDNEYNFDKHEARVAEHRRSAMKEIWAEEGFAGILRLSSASDADAAIGRHLTEIVSSETRNELLDRLLRQVENLDRRKADTLVAGVLWHLQVEERVALLASMLPRYREAGEAEEALRLLKCAPFRLETWVFLDALPEGWWQRYWKEVPVQLQLHGEHEANLLVSRLLAAQRPRAAFAVLHLSFDKIETKLLVQLLREVATSESEPTTHYRPEQYHVVAAFKSLSRRPDLDKAQLIQLEFLYAEALDRSEYGIPALEEALANEPQLFVQLVATVYRRKDEGEDPIEWRISDDERRSRLGTVAFKILNRFTTLPGTREDGTVDPMVLRRWIDSVRAFGAQVGRAAMTDHAIGEVLGRSRDGSDGIWPSPPVREVFDAIASVDMAAGMRQGRYNSRGAHWRAPGGGQERALSEQYRAWANSVAYQYPFTAKFLNNMAAQYDGEAKYFDTQDDVRRRIGH